ncbi:uncharacterized protein DS421_3g84790 [Arachis hypogaea]|nr:uncharacterized protein DS421_3g84790 [Arachis hypogaea]
MIYKNRARRRRRNRCTTIAVFVACGVIVADEPGRHPVALPSRSSHHRLSLCKLLPSMEQKARERELTVGERGGAAILSKATVAGSYRRENAFSTALFRHPS